MSPSNRPAYQRDLFRDLYIHVEGKPVDACVCDLKSAVGVVYIKSIYYIEEEEARAKRERERLLQCIRAPWAR